MKLWLITGICLSCLTINSTSFAEANSDEVAQLKQRVAELEKQVQELSKIIEPLKTQQNAESRQKSLREKFDKKIAQDRTKYTPSQLRDAEKLYQIANQKWGSDEAMTSLQTMIKDFPDINRTGCAILYVAQQSQGDDRTKYLKQCIEKHNDCFYGDGVQVGVYARYLLALDLRSQGEMDQADTLLNEIKSQYPEAIDHTGKLLVDLIKK